MLVKLLLNSFRRDGRRKIVILSAVALATSLATFLLNWSLNLGDKIQRDLREYGANILIAPKGESLPLNSSVNIDRLKPTRYLDSREIAGLKQIFWKNQIVAFAPILQIQAVYQKDRVSMVGTSFYEKGAESYPRTAPYLLIDGRWPAQNDEIVVGEALAKRFGWKIDGQVALEVENNSRHFRITGIVRSGGIEERQVFARLQAAQQMSGHENHMQHLLVSALVSPKNRLYYKYRQSPDALTPVEMERYSCTPYIESVSLEISETFTGSEARILRQISESEENIARKVNWLMILITLAALVASSLTMTSTTTAMIMERRKELALMKAIGSQSGFIVFYLLTEVFLIGAIGSLAGYGLGILLSVGLSPTVFQSLFEIKPIVLPLVLIVGTFIILFGSIWPIRRTLTLEPAQALKDL